MQTGTIYDIYKAKKSVAMCFRSRIIEWRETIISSQFFLHLGGIMGPEKVNIIQATNPHAYRILCQMMHHKGLYPG